MMKKYLLAITLLCITSISFAANKEAIKTKSIPISFVQTSITAHLQAIPDEQDAFKLTIYDASPYIAYYANRPARSSGLAPLPNFVKAWSVGGDSFRSNNPNAVLYAGIINGTPNKAGQFYLLQITDPHYDAAKSKMTYLVRSIGKEKVLFKSLELNYISLVIN